MLGDERSEDSGWAAANDARIPKRRGRPPKVELTEAIVEQQPGISMQEVFELISKMDESRHAQMLEFAKELKKPTEREQKKIDEEEKRYQAQQKARLAQAQAEEQRKKMSAERCPHATVHPGTGVVRHAWRAQVHAPAGEKPFFVPTCQICWTQAPRILATPDMLTQGVNLDQYTGIDFERLKKWAEQAQAA